MLVQSGGYAAIHVGKKYPSPWPPNKQPFHCFQIIQQVSSIREARPLGMGSGVSCLVLIHQSLRDVSWFGGSQVSLSQDRTPSDLPEEGACED
jgi:hypothetical protein